jgi:hypothetical protein
MVAPCVRSKWGPLHLLTEINAPRENVGLGWRQDEDGTWIVARATVSLHSFHPRCHRINYQT